MIEFFNRLFGRQPSGAMAKERLRLVLMSDHLSLAPEMIEAMKRDFVDVISRYVEVDRDKIDVHFEHQDKALAMLANIPILAVTRTTTNGNGTSDDANGTNGTSDDANGTNGHTEPPTSHPEPVEGRLSGSEATNVVEGRQSGSEATNVVEGRLSGSEATAPPAQPKPSKRRRKKAGPQAGQGGGAPAPAAAT